ncbi:lipoyl(octanoyl) transferase LipB [Formicincola oecophyllae]|uniref:Octanoyltransferase n=1 Tax=Formicincola oecophyllae TaxID=2558361 RepID=A0A4Y6U996_9PROT|nr:lipoyl(octanoyl) transferase LipB [Formicincola oecophyllae]QDH12951.1 lipoyl(octanoyl) transferase LipB [Formicincola oecophyllae]
MIFPFSNPVPSIAPAAGPLWWKAFQPIAYPCALEAMGRHVRAMAETRGPTQAPQGEAVWMLEHPPLYTAGTSAKPEHLMNQQRHPTFQAGRGGQWTYHGPGQRVIYAMLDLTRPHGSVAARDIRAYVQGLERWLVAALGRLGVVAFTREGRVGVWCQDPATGQESKIAALGVRVSRWVSWHGVSLNVAPCLEDFTGIVPCGLADYGVTSLARFHPTLPAAALMAAADEALLASWPGVFGPEQPPLA